MAEWFKEYWYLALIFMVVCIVAVFIFRMAGKSYKAYRTSYRNQETEIKRLLALKEKYVPLTEKAIIESDDTETLEGVALSYQIFLQKKEDMEKEFSLLKKEKRYIYILDVFVQDKSLMSFFKENGDILRNEITQALELVGMTEFAQKIERIRKMFDSEDDVVSYSEKEIESLQQYVDESDILNSIKTKSANFIKKNIQLFVN